MSNTSLMNEPMVSVVIPCYNHGRFLPEAVASVVAQDYTNWECIIVDDGSTDDTKMIAFDLTQQDQRIKYLFKKNGGLSSARNAGIELAEGTYIQFLDADDYLGITKFSDSIATGEGSDAIFSDFKMFTNKEEFVDLTFKLKQTDFNLESILKGWDNAFVFPPHSGLFKKDLFDDLRFNETLRAREDWLMWVQIFCKNISVSFIDKPLAFYRLLPDSMSKNKDLMDNSLVQVYRLVYTEIPSELKAMFFEVTMTSFDRLLNEHKDLLKKTRNSKSYRLGNFFVKRFSKI